MSHPLRLKRRRYRAEAARRAWLAQALAYPDQPWPNDSDEPNHAGNSNLPGHEQKVPPASERFKEMVAERAMAAFDSMPDQWREIGNTVGYIGAYLAWRRGWTIDRAMREAARHGGLLVL